MCRAIGVFVIFTAVFCSESGWSAIRAISGATFDPALVPTTNAAITVNSPAIDRLIVDNATLTGIEFDRIFYTDVEGPTNAIVTTVGNSTVYSPFLAATIPSYAEAVTGLTLDGLFNFASVKVMFASLVTTETDGGFFATEYGTGAASDDIFIYPLDSNGIRIGTWQIYLSPSDYGTEGSLLRPHGLRIAVKSSTSQTKPVGQDQVKGAGFTLGDFTGGAGVLNNVQGLEFVDPNAKFDLLVTGIYRGRGESVVYRAGRAVRMRNAKFNQPLVNPMTNDFALTGFDGAASIAPPANAYQFDILTDFSVIWPVNGVQPTRTNALLGLEINGLKDIVYWDFMFAEPVTNATDGFFIIDDVHVYQRDLAFVYPLDADRRPISTYAIATLPKACQWGESSVDVLWDGPADNIATKRSRIGGVVMPLAAFAGGTGGLTQVHGIRIYYGYLAWSAKRIDPLVVGSYKAWKRPQPIYDAECDPMLTPTPSADRLSGTLRHDWTLTSITLDKGRYTDLEGADSVKLTNKGRWYPANGSDPGSDEAAACGLNGAALINADNSIWYFNTIVTNGFDGGFFVFEVGGTDSFRFQPLGVDSNVIAGYSVVIDGNRDMVEKLESFMGLNWILRAVNGYSGDYANAIYGASFTLECITNAVGESLTNAVKGLKLTYVTGNADPVMVGIYKGPTDPQPVPGHASPITAATFTPPLAGSPPYSNDAAVVSVRSADSESWSVCAPSSVAVFKHNGQHVYFPFNGTNPDPNPGAPYTEGYTNALVGLNVNGIANLFVTEHMFDRPVRKATEGFFIIEHNGDDFILVRPLDINRCPISTYSVRIADVMMGDLGFWSIHSLVKTTGNLRGTMIRLSDFAGGAGALGNVYGIRIEEPDGEFDPAVVGQWFGPPDGTIILVR